MAVDLKETMSTLRRGQQYLVALCADLPEAAWRWRPAEGKWSQLEVVNHLADEERDDFRRRIDLLLHQPGTPWPPIDPEGWCRDRKYNDRDPEESLHDFVAERQSSLQWLAALRNPDWQRTYEHASGPLRAGDILLSWLVHDQLHARQLVRLHHQRSLAGFAPFRADYAGPW